MAAEETVAVLSPLGAEMILERGSPNHLLCRAWGRFYGSLILDASDYEKLFHMRPGVDPGLHAEVLFAGFRYAEFESFVSENTAAAEHILALEIHSSVAFCRAKLERAQDLVRVARARAAARRAVEEIRSV